MREIKRIFDRVTEFYSSPVRIGSLYESNYLYRVEDLTDAELDVIAEHIAERLGDAGLSAVDVLVSIPGTRSVLIKRLSEVLGFAGQPLRVVSLETINAKLLRGRDNELAGMNVILVNDVITTARTCLEAHGKITLMGASVTCWVTLVDRTFGPGPVSVVSAFVGEPVRLLE